MNAIRNLWQQEASAGIEAHAYSEEVLHPRRSTPTETPMLTYAYLVAAGFQYYPASDFDKERHHHRGLYQKKVTNNEGQALYFIDVREYWPFPLHADTPEEHAARIHARNQFGITAQLYTTTGLTMDLDLHYDPDSTTPASIEAFYAHAHLALGCGTDPHN